MEDNEIPMMVGTLNKAVGIKGFELAEVGHPVFELKDRYIIYLESLTPEQISGHGIETYYQYFKVGVPYYKKTLAPFIDLIKEKI